MARRDRDVESIHECLASRRRLQDRSVFLSDPREIVRRWIQRDGYDLWRNRPLKEPTAQGPVAQIQEDDVPVGFAQRATELVGFRHDPWTIACLSQGNIER